MGHIKFNNLVNISKVKVVRDIPRITNPLQSVCKQCQNGKHTRVSFKTIKEYITSRPLDLVHTYLCGPTITKGLKGECYFVLFIDDFT